MKIALAQLNYTIGDFESNKMKIIRHVNRARKERADLLVFAEQAISGTPAYDLLNKVTFLDLAEEALVEIASYCDDLAVIVGLPIQHENQTISAAALIRDRKIIRYVGKQNIASRDEAGYVFSSKGPEFVKIGNHKVAIVVGEDIDIKQEYGEYADTIVHITAHPYSRGVVQARYDFYGHLAYTTGKNVVFLNQVGGHTDIIYDGSSAVFDETGGAICLLKNFEEDFQIVTLDGTAKQLTLPYQNKTVNVYRAIKLGLKDYFEKNGFTKACLGLSGGIDSAVVVVLAAQVLGPENVRVLMMPSQFSSDHSVDDAREQAEILGIQYEVISITDSYKAIMEAMGPVFGDLLFDVAEENIQARIRGLMVMAISNKFGNILLNSSNKSEVAVGYGTLYGDMNGAISILGDLYKSEVYDLARYLNKDKILIPENIIRKEPSAELRPEQKDSDSLPPYDILDAILYRMIEEGQSREEIINAGFDAEWVYRIYAMVVKNEHKRFQLCPILRLATRTLGIGRVMPLTNKYM